MPKSFYDAVGGAKTFDAIVSRFYAQVAEDEVLRRVYPEDDLAGAEERLRMFLEQYWGGPRTYSEQRDHHGSPIGSGSGRRALARGEPGPIGSGRWCWSIKTGS